MPPGTRARPVTRTPTFHCTVYEIDPRADPRWEAFVAARPEAVVYQHPAWLDALASEYGQEPVGLVCEAGGGELRGVLPLFRVRGLPFRVEGQGAGPRLSSLPRTPVAGPLAVDDAAAAALLTAAVERVRAESGVRLQLKTEGRTLDGLVDGLQATPWLLAYSRELPDDPEALRFGNSRNHGRIMWTIRQGEHHGVEVRPAESEDELRGWYRLYLETMRAHAIPPRPYRFFAALWRLLRPRGLMRLLLAEQRDPSTTRLIAGSVFVMFGRTVFYAFTGARAADLPLRPNDLIQSRAMRDAVEAGFRRYDLGEVSEGDSGLAAFKKKWGATPSRLYRYYYPSSGDEPSGVLGSGRTVRVATAVWGRLPLGVTVLLGDRLYRYS